MTTRLETQRKQAADYFLSIRRSHAEGKASRESDKRASLGLVKLGYELTVAPDGTFSGMRKLDENATDTTGILQGVSTADDMQTVTFLEDTAGNKGKSLSREQRMLRQYIVAIRKGDIKAASQYQSGLATLGYDTDGPTLVKRTSAASGAASTKVAPSAARRASVKNDGDINMAKTEDPGQIWEETRPQRLAASYIRAKKDGDKQGAYDYLQDLQTIGYDVKGGKVVKRNSSTKGNDNVATSKQQASGFRLGYINAKKRGDEAKAKEFKKKMADVGFRMGPKGDLTEVTLSGGANRPLVAGRGTGGTSGKGRGMFNTARKAPAGTAATAKFNADLKKLAEAEGQTEVKEATAVVKRDVAQMTFTSPRKPRGKRILSNKGFTEMATKKKRAGGYMGAFTRAKNAGNNAGMNSARAEMKKLGYRPTAEGLRTLASGAKGAAKPAAAKRAAKKTVTRADGTQFKVPAKKAPAKKAAAKPAKAEASAKRAKPTFSRGPKGSKKVAVGTTTTYRKGKTETTITRSYKSNPMGNVGQFATMSIAAILGYVVSDLADRFVATMPRAGAGDDKNLTRLDAAMAIQTRPDGKRLGVQAIVAGVPLLLAYYLAKKNKNGPSMIVGGFALGAIVKLVAQSGLISNAMAKVLPAAPETDAEGSLGDRLYYAEGDKAQADIEAILTARDVALAKLNPAAPGGTVAGGRLHGMQERLGDALPVRSPFRGGLLPATSIQSLATVGRQHAHLESEVTVAAAPKAGNSLGGCGCNQARPAPGLPAMPGGGWFPGMNTGAALPVPPVSSGMPVAPNSPIGGGLLPNAPLSTPDGSDGGTTTTTTTVVTTPGSSGGNRPANGGGTIILPPTYGRPMGGGQTLPRFTGDTRPMTGDTANVQYGGFYGGFGVTPFPVITGGLPNGDRPMGVIGAPVPRSTPRPGSRTLGSTIAGFGSRN